MWTVNNALSFPTKTLDFPRNYVQKPAEMTSNWPLHGQQGQTSFWKIKRLLKQVQLSLLWLLEVQRVDTLALWVLNLWHTDSMIPCWMGLHLSSKNGQCSNSWGMSGALDRQIFKTSFSWGEKYVLIRCVKYNLTGGIYNENVLQVRLFWPYSLWKSVTRQKYFCLLKFSNWPDSLSHFVRKSEQILLHHSV